MKKLTIGLGILNIMFIPSTLIAQTVDPAQAAYCNGAGGAVEEVPVEFKLSSGRIRGGNKSFCKFEQNKGLIIIGLETFAASEPSIAATYLKKLPEISDASPLWKGPYTNPSYNVCQNLSGTMIGFAMNGNFTDYSGEMDICVFGDGSMASGWTLIYMANHREGYDEIKDKVNAEPLDMKIPGVEP